MIGVDWDKVKKTMADVEKTALANGKSYAPGAVLRHPDGGQFAFVWPAT